MEGVSGSETPDWTREGTGPDREIGAFFETCSHVNLNNNKNKARYPTIEEKHTKWGYWPNTASVLDVKWVNSYGVGRIGFGRPSQYT